MEASSSPPKPAPRRCRAPAVVDGSAFLNHGRLMERAFNTPPIPDFDTIPVMYQGASDDFLGLATTCRSLPRWTGSTSRASSE